jgi:hypothetical protein
VFENVRAEDFLNIDANVETEAPIQEIDELFENHQKACSEERDDEKEEETSQEL